MHLKYRNINDAFTGIVSGIHTGAIPVVVSSSRNGEVLYVEEPVIVSYSHPRERVLFNTARDCNPFLHLYESLWMLAGRNDVAPLAYFAENFKSYSDDGQTLNGAYGYRWRHTHLGWDRNGEEVWGDQLPLLISHLRDTPNTRRAVLTMWTVVDDLLKVGHYGPCKEPGCKNGVWENGAGRALLELGSPCPICKGTGKLLKDCSKDVCCNTHVYFQIENGMKNGLHDVPQFLNMTVCNRSNDAIWGMLGANAVHFSFLQEYVACALGLEVGTYNQMTNNLHVYTETNSGWEPEKWLTARSLAETFPADSYGSTGVPLFKLGSSDADLEVSRARFDKECRLFADLHWRPEILTADTGKQFSTFFLHHIADPMMHAFHMHKQRDYSAALNWCNRITAPDWRLAATGWINKRKLGWERKQREGAENLVDG